MLKMYPVIAQYFRFWPRTGIHYMTALICLVFYNCLYYIFVILKQPTAEKKLLFEIQLFLHVTKIMVIWYDYSHYRLIYHIINNELAYFYLFYYIILCNYITFFH